MSVAPARARDAIGGFQPWAALLFLIFLAGQLAVTIALDPHMAMRARLSWPSLICRTP